VLTDGRWSPVLAIGSQDLQYNDHQTQKRHEKRCIERHVTLAPSKRVRARSGAYRTDPVEEVSVITVRDLMTQERFLVKLA
jgi:hypothetical protein